jgi:hypothetical protein
MNTVVGRHPAYIDPSWSRNPRISDRGLMLLGARSTFNAGAEGRKDFDSAVHETPWSFGCTTEMLDSELRKLEALGVLDRGS